MDRFNDDLNTIKFKNLFESSFFENDGDEEPEAYAIQREWNTFIVEL